VDLVTGRVDGMRFRA